MKRTMRILALLTAVLLCMGLAMAEEEITTDAVEAASSEAVLELEAPADAVELVEADPPQEMVDSAPAADAQLSLTCASATLGVGEKLALLPEDWTGDLPAFSVSKKKYVSISATGEVTALKKGNVTVTANFNGETATCDINVMNAPKSISLGISSVTLGFDAATGMRERFMLTPTLPKNTWSRITYKGYDPGVIAMDGDVIVPMGVGVTRLTAEVCSGKQAFVTVTVLPAPTSVSLDPAQLSICEGDSLDLNVLLSEGSASALEFSSDEPQTVRVDNSGRLTALNRGDAHITVRCFNGLSATCAVQVLPAPTQIIVEPDGLTLGVDESCKLSVRTDVDGAMNYFTFTSSKPKYASVDEKGVVKGLKKGSAVITIKRNGLRATVKVTVKASPTSISFSEKQVVLGYDAASGLGEQAVLHPVFLPKNTASAITYTSSDPSVVDVTPDGTVKAVGIGQAEITAVTANNKHAVVPVTVLSGPERLVFESDKLTLGTGEKFTLKAAAEGGVTSKIEYESDKPGTVRVDEGGKITALSVGTAQITATCFNGATGTCDVTVVPAPTRVTVTPASLTLGVGESSAPLQASTDGETLGRSFVYETTKKKCATVDANGVVKGVKKGSAEIKVSAYNGVYAMVNVTVTNAPKKVTVSPKTLDLVLGDTRTLTAKLPSDAAGAICFETDAPSVALVDQSGNVTAVGYGTAKITARAYNGAHDTCAVRVVAPPAQIVVDDPVQLVTATYSEFPIRVIDALGQDYQGSYDVSFSPEGIAALENGKLLGLAAGDTVMTVTAGAISKDFNVHVVSYKSVHGIQSIAHRGGCGYKPENTLEAFKHAASKGADGVELDARSTKDGYQVIHHDATFKVGSKKYTIEKIKLSELKILKPTVPTLDEALEVIDATGLDIHLELKDTADGAKCVKAIRSHGLEDRTVYFSFYEKQLKQVYKADPKATLGLSLKADAVYNSDALLSRIKSLHVSFLVANKELMNQTVTDYWHKLGLKISVWTPNTRSEVKSLCALGVDFILSDFPDYCVDYR